LGADDDVVGAVAHLPGVSVFSPTRRRDVPQADSFGNAVKTNDPVDEPVWGLLDRTHAGEEDDEIASSEIAKSLTST